MYWSWFHTYPRIWRASLAAALTAILLATAGAPAAGARPDSGLRAGLDAVTAAGMPGVFAELRDGRHATTAASGVADVDTGRPVRPHMRHRVGSITKTFVATALLQLVGEGRLALDAPLGRYLPEFAVPGVTVRMLLNHTSGLGDYVPVLFRSGEDIEARRYTTFEPRDLARMGLAQPRTGTPGTGWSYSNTNYILAGLILEQVTGRPAAYEINRRIIRPLGLSGTYLPGHATRIVGPHSEAYIPWGEGILRDFSEYNMSWLWLAGELVSTPTDVNRFYRALLTGRLLRPAELAQLRTVVPRDPAHPEKGSYGLGIWTRPLPCGPVWGHDGLGFGYSTISLHSADGARQITVAANMSFYNPPGAPDPIADAIDAVVQEGLCPGRPDRSTGRHSWVTAPGFTLP
ncbi:class A beta-lactamase-related serine hydrolase [Micromonospora sp. KC213]|nr:class A beta-lactamase-related serine hydrolase [Micromonospora sp. KC213]